MALSENQEQSDAVDWKDSPLLTGFLFIATMISPAGAPLLAVLTMAGCDVQWEGASQCFLPNGLVAYFLFSYMTPFFFGPLAILWFTACLSAVIISARWFVLASFAAIADQL